MPIDAIDKQPQDISGDAPAQQPLTPAKMAGAQKQQVNRTQLGPKPTNPARQSPTAADKADSQAKDKPDEQPQPPVDAQPQPEHGIGPAWQALTDGIGAISKDPEWMQHPLLRVFADSSAKGTDAYEQDLWGATQWWGRVVNAAFDTNAIHAAAANIEHDNSIGGKVAQQLFGIHNDPASEFAWKAIPYALVMMSEWEPWLWMPAVAAGGPSQVNQLPQAMMSFFGNDLKHPQFQDPEWYARMGSYVLGAALIAKGGGKAAGPLMKFSGRLKLLEPFAEHADRILGGPGDKTPIKGPDGAIYDPNKDPQGHAYATWWNDNLAPVEEKVTAIGKAATQAADQLIAHPDIEGAYQVVKNDPTAKSDFAKLLDLPPTATSQQVKSRFFAMAEQRAISPQLSAKILKDWDRFGPTIGQMGKLHYWHAGEAPYRNVMTSLEGISDVAKKESAHSAMRAANGFRADLWKGVHGFGNDLSEAMVKGILNHGRSTPYYVTKMATAVREVLPTAAERQRVSRAIEAANARGGEVVAQSLYNSLTPHEKWGVDFYRRIVGEVRAAKQIHGRQLEAQPNFFYRVPKRIDNLDAILKGIPEGIRTKAGDVARGRSPFGYVAKEHRAAQITLDPEGGYRAEQAYATTEDANIQRAHWRDQIKADLVERAKKDPDLAKITADPQKLDALAYAEIPDFSTDVLDSLLGSGDRGMVPDVNALYTHQVMESAKQTLVKHDKDGRWHPLAVARSESGQESSPTLNDHFKELHGADTTTDFYKGQGWHSIEGFGSGHVFHPSLADPLNEAIRFGKGDSDAAMRQLKKLSGLGKKMIMLNPAWHSGNMMGRFMMLAGAHPVGVARAIIKARGGADLNPEQAREWWDLQEHEAMEHGLLPPQLNEDVVNTAGKYHALATGDVETGLPLDVKQPVEGIKTAAADTLNAVKGVNSWWQNHVNGLMWSKIHDFSVLSYIVLKDDAINRGMSPGDARLMASSQANSFGGMVSPDRWMNSPAMHDLSQLLLFAPNWWRTFPRILLNSYDRMGMKSNPALTHAWALNGAKTIGAMILLKGATDNLLNWSMSGHWQFQNPDGYRNQVTMDRFFPTDPTTGAHHVMEDPMFRQPNDLEKAMGIYEPMQHGDWHPDFTDAYQGTAEVLAARASPLVQALETASNWDIYNTIKHRALRWVDPSKPGQFSGQAAAAGALNFAPFGPAYTAQAGLQGATAAPQTLDWGPFKGTQIPGWAARAFDPNDPLSTVLGWLGVRGGYPAPVSSDARGLSSDETTQLHTYTNDWNNYLTKQQQAVMGGGMTWSDFAYNYKQQAAAYSNKVQGLTGGTSQYMQGADGLLSKYESFYNDKQAFDANGDINWSYVQKQQDQLQSQTDPATWRQMIALKDKREMQFPVLRAYKDSLQNYKNFQDTWAKENGLDGETLRNDIATAASSPNFQQAEAKNPVVGKWYNAKRQWEMDSKQGFAYGLFTNNTYVMRVVSPGGDPKQAEAAEQKILPQIESEEAAGKFVTPTGQ